MSFINITIKNIAGRETNLFVKTDYTIRYGKSLYGPTDPQWKFMAKVLQNNKTFADYEIEDGDVITSNDRSEGGIVKSKINK